MQTIKNYTTKSVLLIAILVFGILGPVLPARAGDDYPWSSQCPTNGYYNDGYGYYKCQCTSFVAWRLRNNNGFGLPAGIGNGGSWNVWARNHGYAVDNSPAVGAVAEMSGHVAWVAAVSGGNVTVEEYNWNWSQKYGSRTVSVNSFWYIHFKDISVQQAFNPSPAFVPWNFENLEGDLGSISHYDSNVGQNPSFVQFGTSLHGFYRDAGNGVSSLRHAWSDSTGWHFETLDGKGGPNGRANSNTGYTPRVVSYNNRLYVFYYDKTNGNLRIATSDGSGSNWSFENLDGDSTVSGRLIGDLGITPSPVVSENILQAFYFDTTNGNLRHAWLINGIWKFEDLDGTPNSIGKYNYNLGYNPSAISLGKFTQVFYYDLSNNNLRHAWTDSTGWHFENLDGDPGSIGKTNSDLGVYSSVAVLNNNLQLIYSDSSRGDLRHAWTDSTGWHFENLDGDPGSISHYDAQVGFMSSITSFQGNLQVLYYDTTRGDLRHAWTDSTGWHFENLDGSGGEPQSRSTKDVGYDPYILNFNNTLQAFYLDASNGNLRHAYFK